MMPFPLSKINDAHALPLAPWRHAAALAFVLLAVGIFAAVMPGLLHAAIPGIGGLAGGLPPIPGGGCAGDGALTARVVACVKKGLLGTVGHYLTAMQAYVNVFVSSILTLSTVFMGYKALLGMPEMRAETVMFVIRFSLVLFFTTNFGGMTPVIFETVDDLQGIVTSSLGDSPNFCPAAGGAAGAAGAAAGAAVGAVTGSASMAVWERMDCLIGRMFGVGAGFTIINGVLGIIAAGLFSGTVGVQFFFVGVACVAMVVFMVLRAVFITLMAYTAISFLIIISPLIIPLVMFRATGRYFQVWLGQLVGAMLQPVMLYGVLAFSLGIFEYVLVSGPNSLMSILGPDFTNILRSEQPTLAWTVPYDFTAIEELMGKVNKTIPTVPEFINSLFARAPNVGVLNTYAIDFGSEHTQKLVKTIYALASIMLVMYLMMSIMNYVPQIAASIAGASGGFNVVGQPLPLEPQIKSMYENVQARALERVRGRKKA